ncbi:hypothetical protein CORT_0C00520 [Candida orthopsilosis Co 90-125]|uniref:Uncharacterized protein n=1 Tax=Candida orthopsilosis (strain 90-125) TaxID=1136231 RepID=H8X3F8_CANO9|nr:hypothetical protein CORT_0C00520 [Candida orthopsilosis Co 90-125]CCG25431.1 hypothetical protein CORT_0C00520 [Candida orthopsilosis Co 90-125]
MSNVNTTVFTCNFCSNQEDSKQIPDTFLLFIKIEVDGEVMKFLHVASR